MHIVLSTQYTLGVKIMSGGYACSEGFFGIYLGPARMNQIAYLPFPTDTVAEFIREDDM